jgi:uncharacterized protein with FMN-binding domain
MKKFFVSSVVIIAFLAYSIYQRVNGSNVMPVISPKVSLSQTSPIPTNTPTPIPTSVPTATSVPISQSITLQPTPTNKPTPIPTPTPTPRSGYKDGTYTGVAADAFYGNIQVQATISNGKITNVQFLQAPNDRGTSIYINSQADPMLAQEAIQAQSANVNIVSGATDSSNAFIQSMQSALDKAKS